MGKARIHGTNVHLYFMPQVPLAAFELGEVDDFKAKSRTKIIHSRPIGSVIEGATLQYGGWDLTFEMGKVDWKLCHMYYLQDLELRGNIVPPKYSIFEEIQHYDGSIEQFIYRDVTLFNLDISRPSQESKETIQGFSPIREIGPLSIPNLVGIDELKMEAYFAAKLALDANGGALNVVKNTTGSIGKWISGGQ